MKKAASFHEKTFTKKPLISREKSFEALNFYLLNLQGKKLLKILYSTMRLIQFIPLNAE